MTIDQINEHNITREEIERIGHYIDGLSDFCEMTDGTWGIEWDGIFGRHWERFETEADALEALKRKDAKEIAYLPAIRRELAEEAEENRIEAIEKQKTKVARIRLLKEARTIGGNCPELAALLVKVREEYRRTV